MRTTRQSPPRASGESARHRVTHQFPKSGPHGSFCIRPPKPSPLRFYSEIILHLSVSNAMQDARASVFSASRVQDRIEVTSLDLTAYGYFSAFGSYDTYRGASIYVSLLDTMR